MARYPSNLNNPLVGDEIADVRARLAWMAQAMEEHPIGTTAPCANPECTGPVDYLGHGAASVYCSHACRSRASDLRRAATEQLDLIDRTLEETHHMKGVPRAELRARANMLRWWLTRLGERI